MIFVRNILLTAAACFLAVLSAGCCSNDEPSLREDTLLVFDTDPGLDDAIALFLLHSVRGGADIAVSTFGNTSLEHTHRNLVTWMRYFGDRRTCVFKGSACSLAGIGVQKFDFHGLDGIAGQSGAMVKKLALTDADFNQPSDLQEVVRRMMAAKHVSYVAVGPLTNLAKMLEMEPKLAGHIANVYCMGGGLKVFNSPHQAEFNFCKDGPAVRRVFASGLDITLFPLDFTMQYPLTKKNIQTIEALGTYPEISTALRWGYSSEWKYDHHVGFVPHDAFPVLYCFYPGKFTVRDRKFLADKYGHLTESPSGRVVHVAESMEPGLLFELILKFMRDHRKP